MGDKTEIQKRERALEYIRKEKELTQNNLIVLIRDIQNRIAVLKRIIAVVMGIAFSVGIWFVGMEKQITPFFTLYDYKIAWAILLLTTGIILLIVSGIWTIWKKRKIGTGIDFRPEKTRKLVKVVGKTKRVDGLLRVIGERYADNISELKETYSDILSDYRWSAGLLMTGIIFIGASVLILIWG